MYRSNTCGELRLSDAGKEVTLAGWVQRSRKMGGSPHVLLLYIPYYIILLFSKVQKYNK